MSDLKCPYAKALAQGFDIHIDCLDCPSSVCNYPQIHDRFWEIWNKRSSKFMNEIREKKIVEMRKQGMTYRQIGEAVGLTGQRVHMIVSKLPPIRKCDTDFNRIIFEGIYQCFLQDHTMTYARLARVAYGSKTVGHKEKERIRRFVTGAEEATLKKHWIDNIIKFIGKPYEEVFAPRKGSDA